MQDARQYNEHDTCNMFIKHIIFSICFVHFWTSPLHRPQKVIKNLVFLSLGLKHLSKTLLCSPTGCPMQAFARKVIKGNNDIYMNHLKAGLCESHRGWSWALPCRMLPYICWCLQLTISILYAALSCSIDTHHKHDKLISRIRIVNEVCSQRLTHSKRYQTCDISINWQ